MAMKPELRRDIATIGTDPNRWHWGALITPEDSTLASRGQGKGLWLYDELERDGQVFAVLQKRRAAVLSRPWEVEPADDTEPAARAAALVTAQLRGLGVEPLVEALLEALLKGVAVVEVIWGATALGVAPVAAKARDPRRFAFRAVEGQDGALDHELRLLTKARPNDGEAVPPLKFIVHRYGRRYDNPWGLGLGHRLFWPVYFKRKGIAFWLGALEKFGQPTGLGRYPAGTPEAEQKKLLEALMAIATDAGVIVPEGMEVELIEAKRSGTFESYERLARYMDEDIAKIVLGETLTTSVGESGSRALGDVHNAVRLELARADADLLSATLNATLVRWIVALNLPSAPPPRLWWDTSEPEDLDAQAARDEKLAAIGFRPTLDRVRAIYGEGYEPAAPPPPDRGGSGGLPALFRDLAIGRPLSGLRRPAAPCMPTGAKDARTAFRPPVSVDVFGAGGSPPGERGSEGAFGEGPGGAEGDTDAVRRMADRMDAEAAPTWDAILDRVAEIVADATSLEDLRQRLLDAFHALPRDRLGEVLAMGLTAAELAGRFDASGR